MSMQQNKYYQTSQIKSYCIYSSTTPKMNRLTGRSFEKSAQIRIWRAKQMTTLCSAGCRAHRLCGNNMNCSCSCNKWHHLVSLVLKCAASVEYLSKSAIFLQPWPWISIVIAVQTAVTIQILNDTIGRTLYGKQVPRRVLHTQMLSSHMSRAVCDTTSPVSWRS